MASLFKHSVLRIVTFGFRLGCVFEFLCLGFDFKLFILGHVFNSNGLLILETRPRVNLGSFISSPLQLR